VAKKQGCKMSQKKERFRFIEGRTRNEKTDYPVNLPDMKHKTNDTKNKPKSERGEREYIKYYSSPV